MSIEWTGAAVEPDDDADPSPGDGPPSPDTWEDLAVPGRPPSLAGADAAVYRGRFADPRDDEGERALLVVHDVYARATVWINGERRGAGTQAGPVRVPFEPAPSNEVVILCRAPSDGFGGLEDSAAVPESASVPSIRGRVEVEAVPAAYIHDLVVRGDPSDDPSIRVTATVDAAEPVDDRMTLSLRPEGFRGGGAMERVHVRAEAGQRVRVEREVEVRDPRRWSPRTVGQQYRYTVRATLGDHERTRTTGLVTVDRDGGDLLINGHRHRPRGVVAPPTAEPEAVVERALDANATLVRARAHVPPERLATACDEAGLLYWQDLPLHGPGSFDVERGRELAEQLVAARDHHPSLVCYGVHDEPARPFEGLDRGSGLLDRLRFRWRAWRASYDPADAEVLAAALPSDRVVFTVAGPPGTSPDAAHVSPGWAYLDADAVEWLLDRYPDLSDVVGATGAGALSRPVDGPASGLEQLAVDRLAGREPEATQRDQARVLTTVLEALRRRETGTIVVNALSDVVPEGGMGLVDADGERRPAFRAVADAFEPVQAVLDGPPTPGATGVTVCNDTPEDCEGELAWTAGNHSGTVDVSAPAFGRADAGAVDVPANADRVTLELRVPSGTVTNTYDCTLWADRT